MEWNTVVTAAVGAIQAWIVAQALGNLSTINQGVFLRIGSILTERLVDRFKRTGDTAKEAVLNQVLKTPESPAAAATLNTLLTQMATADPAGFGRELRELVAPLHEHQTTVTGTYNHNELSGQVSGTVVFGNQINQQPAESATKLRAEIEKHTSLRQSLQHTVQKFAEHRIAPPQVVIDQIKEIDQQIAGLEQRLVSAQ